MTILREQRAELQNALSDLVNGRTPVLAFDEVYFRLYESEDRGVAEIAAFGRGFYGDLDWGRYINRQKLTDEQRAMTDRCDLFLNTEVEYKWPDFQESPIWDLFWGGLSIIPGAAVFSIAAIVGGAALLAGHVGFCAGSILVTLIAFLPAFLMIRRLERLKQLAIDHYWSHGDRNAWPFLKKADLDAII